VSDVGLRDGSSSETPTVFRFPRSRHHPAVGRYAIPALFSLLTAAFLVIAVAALDHDQWVIGLAAAALALWMGQFAWSAMRRIRR